MGGAYRTYGREKKAYGVCWGKTSYERPRCRWKNNMKLCLQIVRWGSMGWIFVSWNRDKWSVLSLGCLVIKHNCVNIGVFIDFVEQLHVSAFIGHRQVVLREVSA